MLDARTKNETEIHNAYPTNIYDVTIALIKAKVELIRNTAGWSDDKLIARADGQIQKMDADIDQCLEMIDGD